MCSHWPHRDTTATDLRNMYVCIILYLEAEAESISRNLKTKPFLETNLGRLPPEIRGMIFINLLATPPQYSGRDFRVKQVPTAGQSPLSLTTFVDLRASCFAALQTCRQVYLEAFPIFYASKSYYFANSQDLAIFFKLGRRTRIGLRFFRVDTITSLCLKNLVVNKLKWTPRQVDDLISNVPTFNRATLEAERITELDSKLIFADLEEMKCLRKICLCMCVGQELLYLRFLFGIKGLKRGVIGFVDNHHWTIRSQSVLEDIWSLQYTPFPVGFYRRGKDFEMLDYEVVRIQGEVLDIDSRASDLVEGDERWVEVEIGSRDYEEVLPPPPQQQHTSVNVPAPVSETQLGIADGEGDGSPTNEGSIHETEHQQEYLNRDLEGTQTDNESDHESDEPYEQPDGEGDSTQIDSEQDQEPANLRHQPDEDKDGSRTENVLAEESEYAQGLADGQDTNAQAGSNSNKVSGSPQGPANEDRASTSNETETENLAAPLRTEDGNTPIISESDQGLENSIDLSGGRATYDQKETDHPRMPETTLEIGNEIVLEYKPTETIQAETELALDFPSPEYGYRDAQTQTEPVNSRYRNAETQTELRERATEVQKESQVATALTPKNLKPDQDTVEQPKGRGRKWGPAQPDLKAFGKPQDSAKSQPEKIFAAKSDSHNKASPAPQRSPQKSIISPLPQKQETFLATTKKTATLRTARKSLPTSHTTLHLHGLIRAAAFMLALFVLYLLFYAELENMLGQILALLLFVLLFFVVLGSGNE